MDKTRKDTGHGPGKEIGKSMTRKEARHRIGLEKNKEREKELEKDKR